MTFTFEEFCKRMQAEIIKYLPNDCKDCKTVIMPCNKPGKCSILFTICRDVR